MCLKPRDKTLQKQLEIVLDIHALTAVWLVNYFPTEQAVNNSLILTLDIVFSV